MSEHVQVWVRNDKGQVYGPLSPPSVELLIDNGIIAGRMQVSTDGLNYVFPGRVPGLRMIFPRETWGETIIPGDELDAAWSQVVLPPNIAAQAGGAAPGGVPVAGPGVPTAGPGIASSASGFRAGPGTQVRAPARPPGAPSGYRPASPSTILSSPSGVQSTPSGVAQAPVRSSPSIAEFFNAATGANPAAAAPRSAAGPAPARPATEPRLAPPGSSGSGLHKAPAPPPANPGDARMPASGTLADYSAPRLYGLAATTESTGPLTLKLDDRELVVHFRKGNPEFLDSTHPEDSLDVFLINQKLATAQQISQAQAQAGRFGGELIGALFGLGLLNPNAAFQHLAQRASGLLARALASEQGEFSFDLEDLPPSKAMPLGNKWAVYLEAMRRIPGVAIRRRLMGVLDNPVMKSSGLVAVSELRLTPQETRALNYFDGVRSLNQLAAEIPGEVDHIFRTAWMLMHLDLVTFAGVTLSTPRPPPQKPAAAAPRAPPAAVPGPPVMVTAPTASAVPGPPVMVTAAPASAVPGPPVMGAGGAPQRPTSAVLGPAPVAGTVPGPPPAVANAPRPGPGVAAGNPPARPPGPSYPGGAPPTAVPPGVSQSRTPSAALNSAAPGVSQSRTPSAALNPAAPGVSQSRTPSAVIKPPSVSGVPAVASPAAAPPDLKQLQDLYAQMKAQNFFDVLGVKRDADANAVKIAYLKAARSYHPDTVPPNSPEALMKVKADIFALISEANRTLSDVGLKANYIGELDAGGVGEKVDVEKLLRAEEQFQKGRVLVQNRKYPDALKLFEDAVANNADEPEFYAWRGYAKYLSASDRKGPVQQEAMRDINLCIGKNPNVASAYFFLGTIQKTNGDEKNALANFKKCVALDPRHIDAAREVRMMTQKK